MRLRDYLPIEGDGRPDRSVPPLRRMTEAEARAEGRHLQVLEPLSGSLVTAQVRAAPKSRYDRRRGPRGSK